MGQMEGGRCLLQMVGEMPGEDRCSGLTQVPHRLHSHPPGEAFPGGHTQPQRQVQGKDSPTHRLASPVSWANQALACSGSMRCLKNSLSHLHTHLETSVYPLFQVPMASPQALLLGLLALVVTEGWGQQAAIPGCHLHRE